MGTGIRPCAAAFLIECQEEAVAGLKARGRIVKVKTVVVPGVNDIHKVSFHAFVDADLQTQLKERRTCIPRLS